MEALIAPGAVDYLLDETTHDIVARGGIQTPAEGHAAIAQGVRVRFNVWREEWFYEPSEGLPVFQKILERGVPLADITGVFDRALLRCPGIASRVSMQVTPQTNTRELNVVFVARTTAGAVLRSSDFVPFVVSY